MCPAGLLNRRMKPDIAYVNSRSDRYAERLNTTIQILVVKRVFIVPHAGTGVRHFKAHEPDAIIARIRLDLVYRRASPRSNGWLLSHGGTHRTKRERLVDSGYGITLVRSVVVHVALARMTLAPGVFMRDDVIRFGKIGRSRV